MESPRRRRQRMVFATQERPPVAALQAVQDLNISRADNFRAWLEWYEHKRWCLAFRRFPVAASQRQCKRDNDNGTHHRLGPLELVF